jgi:hypothetical protein
MSTDALLGVSDGAVLLRKAIAAKCISQGQAERDLGLKRGQLNQYLKGVKCPSRRPAVAIQKMFGVPVEAWDIIEPTQHSSPEESGVFIRANGELIRCSGNTAR